MYISRKLELSAGNQAEALWCERTKQHSHHRTKSPMFTFSLSVPLTLCSAILTGWITSCSTSIPKNALPCSGHRANAYSSCKSQFKSHLLCESSLNLPGWKYNSACLCFHVTLQPIHREALKYLNMYTPWFLQISNQVPATREAFNKKAEWLPMAKQSLSLGTIFLNYVWFK